MRRRRRGTRRTFTDTQKKRAVRQIKLEGWKKTAVAQQLDVSLSTLSRWIDDARYQPSPKLAAARPVPIPVQDPEPLTESRGMDPWKFCPHCGGELRQ